jgi:hypothetical protein
MAGLEREHMTETRRTRSYTKKKKHNVIISKFDSLPSDNIQYSSVTVIFES